MIKAQIGFTELYNLYHSVDLDKSYGLKEDITKLRELHLALDETLVKAYKWDDILLKYDFYEIEFLPENDRLRFTLSSVARKEIIKRLLVLNHELYQEEIESVQKPKKKKGTSTSNMDLFSQ
jgi:hypothetical protein